MMNLLGLCFFLTSLTTATIFSPKPPPNTIVKEGHRVVVVEYDQDGYQNTKISISPEQQQQNAFKNIIDDTNHKLQDAASVLPNLGQGISQSQDSRSHSPSAFDLNAPKELICDAYGKCKHKISNAMGKTKDMAQEALDKKKDEAREVAGKAQETIHDINEYAKGTMEKGKEMGETVKEHVVRNVSDVRDRVGGVVRKFGWGMKESVGSLMGVANLLGFGTAYGMCVWITFVSSYVLSSAMPRQQFAVVQSKIYPIYFRVMGYCLGVALLGHVLGHGKRLFNDKGELLQAYNLLISLLTVLVNGVYLEPRATKLMFERMKIEKEEGRGREDMTATPERSTRAEKHQHSTDPKKASKTTSTPAGEESPTQGTREHDDVVRTRIIKLNNKLKKLNSYSSILNILNLMSLTWHLVYLAQRVHCIC